MRLGRFTGRAVLVGWFIAMLAIGTTLLARHALALPKPMAQDLAPAVERLRGDHGHRIIAVHVLYVDCTCSQRIAAHLLSSQRPTAVEENVLLVGNDAALEARFVSRGFRVHVVDEDGLANGYHIPAAPLLIVAAPDGRIRYAGGYTTSKQGYESHDLPILSEVISGGSPEALPLFGCPVSQRLKARMNPLELP